MKNLTPEKFRCQVGMCPAVYELDDGSILIVGKLASSALLSGLHSHIGGDEGAVIIPADLLTGIKLAHEE